MTASSPSLAPSGKQLEQVIDIHDLVASRVFPSRDVADLRTSWTPTPRARAGEQGRRTARLATMVDLGELQIRRGEARLRSPDLFFDKP